MTERGRLYFENFLVVACALCCTLNANATGVPISGFYPLTGISLTTKHDDDNDPTFSFFQPDYETTYSGTPLSTGNNPNFEIALIDTGAAATLITTASDAAFNVGPAGYRGTNHLSLGGASGGLVATINDPMAIYASGLSSSNRTGTSPLTLNTSLMVGQSSISLATLPVESDLPNILGIPFSSQYATYIRNDQPQIFSVGGKTVRTPQVEFRALGSGGQGITRRVPITLDDPSVFLSSPTYIYDFNNLFANPPLPLTDNPLGPTARYNSQFQAAAAYFVNVNVTNEGHSLTNKPFLLDTGADVSVVSEINAVNLGFDPVLDTPDFTVTIMGSGGLRENVPGFYVDQFVIPAVGGTITLNHVPFLVLDFPNPAHIGNVAEGLLGMNALAGRNVVIDPNPATGQGGTNPSLYISDPVTTSHNWATTSASGNWATSGSWNAAGTPSVLWITNARNVSGSAQEAVVSADSTVWEVNISGSGTATMTARVQSGATLTSFSGVNIESGGAIKLEGGAVDAQFVDIRGGTLTGAGTVFTGSGPIPGQVENHGGVVAPGNGVGTLNISGRFGNASDGTLSFELGGATAGTYDVLAVDGAVALDGTLSISLVGLGGPTFVPSVGNQFTLITATGIVGGTFDQLLLPDGYNWKMNYLSNSLQLVVGNPGDFNYDGTVDGRDYVVWRKTSLGPLNLQAWRSHFGSVYSGSGSGSAVAASVPEPASVVLLAAIPACALMLRRRLVNS